LKILQIGKFYPPYHLGGIETVTQLLHNGLRERNIENDFMGFLPESYKSDVTVDEHIYLCKTDINKFSTQFSWSFIKRWRKVKEQYDIVVISMPHPFVNLVLNLFPSSKAKIVLWWHNDIIKQKLLLQLYKPFLISLLKRISAVIAATNIHIDQSDFSKYLVPKKHIILFPFIFKKQKYPYCLNDGKFVVFSCGRLIYYKGFDVLIDAAEYLPDNCIIHIAGEGALYNKLSKQIIRKGLSKKVILLGRISDEQLEFELRNCFLYCLSSVQRTEGFGVVQVDAFCHGKPVISTNIPRSGVPEVNKDTVSGYIVEINNPKAIADKINFLLHDSIKYEQLCENAFARGNELTDRNIINKYIELFEAL
jgi:rhamnosyl/mannosyltransferase